MPKKRSKDDMEVDSEEIDDDGKDDDVDIDDDDDHGEEKAAEDHDMDDVMESPSPQTKKKDMHLRSGRRKRRRSRETTGLTPPDQISKKSRLTDKKKAAAASGKKQEADESLPPLPQQEVHSPQANGSLPPLQQQAAAAAASIPAAASLGDVSLESSPKQAGRKLFDSTPLPPPPAHGTVTKADSLNVTETEESGNQENAVQSPHADDIVGAAASGADDTLPQGDVKHPSIPSSPVATSNGHHAEEDFPVGDPQEESLDYHWAVSFFWMMFFGGLFLLLLPYSVDVSDALVPLDGMVHDINETEIYSNFERKLLSQLPPIENDLPEEDDDDFVDVAVPKIPAAIHDGLRSLQTLQDSLENSKQGLSSMYREIQRTINKASVVGGNRKRNSDKVVENLHNMREKLSLAVDHSTDLLSQTWKEIVEANEFHIPDTSLLQLWEVDDPFICSDGDAENEKLVIDPDILSPGALEQEFADVMERTQLSVDNIRNDHDMEGNVRQWIRSQIETSVRQNEDANDALVELATKLEGYKSGDVVGSAFSSGYSAEDIETLISNRLENEMADRTGKYDHASLLNGGKVIYGGKRGTSKSLVDDLPLYNRIMQVSKLRFYGYGPEAAIVPTWPSDALGQCWSFQQTPVKELMKRRRSRDTGDANDHKRGSFGTLTISLPHPVNVKSIVVEHPPKGLTDNPKSAIRNFRVIGYQDPMAAGKSWSLGSFEYDIANKNPTQEFQVATEIFRTLVPPLQSITLAIDSNWGNDFACLYRLRVHGELEE